MIGWLADILTALRLALAFYLAWVGLTGRDAQVALTTIVNGLLLGWTADILDGHLARKVSSPTKLGRWDFPLDMAMVLGSLIGITAAGFIPPSWTAVYLAFSTVLIIRFPTKAMVMALACPAVFAPFLLAANYVTYAFRLSVLWAAVMLVLDWGRFEAIVLEFIDTFPGGKLRPLGLMWRRWKGV